MSEFLAEARILVRPDTTRFRALLEAELLAATRKPIVVPVTTALVGGATSGTEAIQRSSAAAAGALHTQALAAREAASATGDLVRIQKVSAVSANDAARAELLLTTASSGIARAQIAAGVAIRNVARQEEILAAALRTGNAELIRVAALTSALVRIRQAETAAALEAARAELEHASALGAVGKAGIAGSAGLLGLRGAVLTAGGAFIAATVGIQAFAKAIGSAISFERELNVFQVTAGATADQMERVGEVSRQLGRDITLPGVAANDAAEALSALARAGLSVEDSINAVRGTLQLATAAEIDNASAVELVANALNSFKLDGTEATRVADLLAGAAAESQGSISDMGLALKQVSAIASGLGISIEDTVTILTQLARAGLSASDAGTSFRQTLLRLIQDLPKVEKEVDNLGLNLRDISGNIRPEVFEELGRKLKTLTPAARQLAIANLGGADAIRTLLILTRAQAGEFDALERSITRAGLAQDLAAARTQGLGGDVEAAKNEFADLGLTIGQVSSGPLGLFVRTASQAVGAINDVNAAAERAGGHGGFLTELGKVVDDFAGSFARLNISFQQGVRLAQAAQPPFSSLAGLLERAENAANGLAEALAAAGENLKRRISLPKDQGLGVQQILNRVSGFDSAEVRARISGDTAELISVLEQEQQFLIQQLDRQFVKNRPALQHALERNLLGITNDLASISKEEATETKKAATEAAQAISEADQALLTALSQRRNDAERRAGAAGQTAGLQDDIRAQDRIQALIKIQIAKIKVQVKDQQTRKAALRELRLALIASRNEEDALRAEQRQQQIEAKTAGIKLDVELADINENDEARIALRRRLIQRLLRERKLLHLTGNALKENRNEIARIRAEIKAIQEEERGAAEDSRKSAAQFFFEQLQAQQGFASNLLGNLIPRGQTAGLVGNEAPTALDVGQRITVQASAAQGKALGGPTAGQANATNDLLLKILNQLKHLNGLEDAPEAKHQRRTGRAALDYHH